VSFFPSDSSFMWGAIGAIAAFGTGFLQKAGEKAFAHFEDKMNPKAEPIQVDGRVVPSVYPPG
jgi:hypothetical protein